MVALFIYEKCLKKQIEAEEQRDEIRFPLYDKNNVFRKQAND